MVHVAAQNIVCDNLKYLVEQYQADLTALDKVQVPLGIPLLLFC